MTIDSSCDYVFLFNDITTIDGSGASLKFGTCAGGQTHEFYSYNATEKELTLDSVRGITYSVNNIELLEILPLGDMTMSADGDGADWGVCFKNTQSNDGLTPHAILSDGDRLNIDLYSMLTAAESLRSVDHGILATTFDPNDHPSIHIDFKIIKR